MAVGPVAPPVSLGGWLRIALRLPAMVAWLLICLALYQLWRLRGPANPWPRRFLMGFCRLGGIRVRVVGQPRRGGVFLLANHISWIDIPALAGVTGTAFVAHDGLAGIPLLKWLCALNDTVFVARHDRRSVHRQVEQVREAIRDTGALAIFPEGTTGNGDELLPFKSSLLSAIDPVPAGIAVQPVLLDYGAEAARIAWVGEEPGLGNFLRILARRRPVELTVRFLAPLQGDALAGRKAMAAAAREAIGRAMLR